MQIWGLNASTPHFSLEGHERGVNCISYFPGGGGFYCSSLFNNVFLSSGEKPFLVSGADDQVVKIWDYQTKSCVATLEGHSNNVSAVMFHPHLPLIVTGSEVFCFLCLCFFFKCGLRMALSGFGIRQLIGWKTL